MSIQDEAARVILAEQEEGNVGVSDVAGALADAGLLAPELPEPGPSIFEDDDTLTWVTPTDTGGRHVLKVRDGEVMDGAVARSPDTARQIGLMWLAAAKEAEGK